MSPSPTAPDESTAAEASRTPAQVWADLQAGNDRFVGGQRSHPHQDVERRTALRAAQRPSALFLGCADSRVAAEIIFDQGLGDLFVVRTAGHVVDSAVLGSIEFAVAALQVPLIVILGHDSCGAVKAAIDVVTGGTVPKGYIRDVVERVTPSVLTSFREGRRSVEEIETEHVRQTLWLLTERSRVVADAVNAGDLAIIAAQYALHDGRATVVESVGPVNP